MGPEGDPGQRRLMPRTIVPIGPYHPLQEEPEFFSLTVEGEKVVDIDVHVGYNHRGIEKLSEMKTFDQSYLRGRAHLRHLLDQPPLRLLPGGGGYLPRLKYPNGPNTSAPSSPKASAFIRISSGWGWPAISSATTRCSCGPGNCAKRSWTSWRILSGNRNNYGMFKPGGVRRDIKPEDIPGVLKKIDSILPTLDMLRKAVMDDPVLQARTKGIGILSKDEALNYRAVGPTARASGVASDVRKDSPYAAYDQVDWEMIVTQNGDVFDKLVIRVLEIYESVKILKHCLTKLPPGEIDAKLKIIPPGEGIGTHEAPRGETFHYVRSDGTNRPVRHKVRAPTFMNLPTYKSTIVGETLSDATIILAAIDPCYCCTERVAVRNTQGTKLFNGEDLVRLSQEKTEKLRKDMGA